MVKGIWLSFILSLFLGYAAFAQPKTRINRADELPRRTIALSGNVKEIFQNDTLLERLAVQLRKNAQSDLDQFEIADKATLSGYYTLMLAFDLHEGRFGEALQVIEQLKDLEDKPEEKASTGISSRAYIEAVRNSGAKSGPAFEAAFGEAYARALAAADPKLIRPFVQSTKMTLSLFNLDRALHGLATSLQPFIDNGKGQVPEGIGTAILLNRMVLDRQVPLMDEMIAALEAWLQAHPEESEEKTKVDYWNGRNQDLSPKDKGQEVRIAVWDTGVDPKPLGKAMWKNPKEKPGNGIDDDRNGFVDDVHGIAFGMDNKKTTGPLIENRELTYSVADLQRWTKGLMDLQAGISSAEAANIQQQYQSLKPEESTAFQEDLSWYGVYMHGTHVAGIAAAGNPFARLLYSRLTYDTRTQPRCPTEETQADMAKMYGEAVAYFKKNQVKVVNMSWRYNAQAYEGLLNMYGVGKDEQERRAIANRWFEAERRALTEAFRSAPEILFICGSGNENNDANFADYIPAGIDLPNLITIGAVNDEGKRTSFTSEGKSIDFYANGFEVESFVPGGARLKFSGTSMASPQVANLAGKLLALQPELKPTELIALIDKGSEPMAENPQLKIINPKRSIDLLLKEMKKEE